MSSAFQGPHHLYFPLGSWLWVSLLPSKIWLKLGTLPPGRFTYQQILHPVWGGSWTDKPFPTLLKSKPNPVLHSRCSLKVKVKVTQSCLTLCDPMDYTVHGILQARILEWIAFSFSWGSSQPRDRTQVSRIAGRFFTRWATRKDPKVHRASFKNISLVKPRVTNLTASNHQLKFLFSNESDYSSTYTWGLFLPLN